MTERGSRCFISQNSLGHVVLTNNLLPLLRKTAKMPGTDVRMIHMSSELHRATFGSALLGE